MKNRILALILAVIALATLFACGEPAKTPKVLRVGFVPAEDAAQVMQNAQPVVEILRKELGMEIQPFVATDYTGVVEALRANKLDVAFLTPASYVLAKNENQRPGRPQIRAQGHSSVLCPDHHPRGQRHKDP